MMAVRLDLEFTKLVDPNYTGFPNPAIPKRDLESLLTNSH